MVHRKEDFGKHLPGAQGFVARVVEFFSLPGTKRSKPKQVRDTDFVWPAVGSSAASKTS